MPFRKPKPTTPPIPKQDKVDKTYSIDLKNFKLEKKTTYAPRPQPQPQIQTQTVSAVVAQQVVETPAGPATTSTWFAKSWTGTGTNTAAKGQEKQTEVTTTEVVGKDVAQAEGGQTTLMAQAAGVGSMVTYVACCAAAGAVFLAGVGAGRYTPNKGGKGEK